jgi:fucose 4-O-acetylase-like acetyltransferase
MPERDHRIDNARALGILLVVLGHVWSAPPWLHKWILSFHMPFFFILSGYTSPPSSVAALGVGRYLARRFERLLVPCWFLGLLCAVPSVLTGHTTSAYQFAKRVAGTIYSVPLGDFTFYCTPIWFLPCLWCVYALSALLARLPARTRCLCALLSLCVGLLVGQRMRFYWPWNLNIAFSGVFLFQSGTWLRQHAYFDRRRLPLPAVLALLGFSAGLSVLNGDTIRMSSNQLGKPGLFLASAYCGSILLLEVSKRLPPIAWMSSIGRYTIVVLALNYWMWQFVHEFLGLWRCGHWALEFLLQCLLLVAVVGVVRSSWLLRWLANGEPPGRREGHRA